MKPLIIRVAQIAVVAFVVTALYLLHSQRAHLPISIPTSLPSVNLNPFSKNPFTSTPSGSIAPYAALNELCANTSWRPDLYLNCHSFCGPLNISMCGGLKNARNRLQTCLRLAIDTGATLVLPTVVTRNEGWLTGLDSGEGSHCPDFFWDIGHLVDTMGRECPQLQMRMCGDISGIDPARIVDAPPHSYMMIGSWTGQFRIGTDAVLEAAGLNVSEIDASAPALMHFGDAYLAWNYALSEELATVRKDLFRAVKFNPDLLALGAQVLQLLRPQGRFIGIHFRGESDWPGVFGSADDQMRLYTEECGRILKASKGAVRTVYVSCGDVDAIQRLREKLEPLGFVVHDKLTLATEAELRNKIDALAFDQRAIVEYETLVNADYFLGIGMSSFSSLIAYAREVEYSGDFFTDYIFPGTERDWMNRMYKPSHTIRGNEVREF